MIEIRRGRLFLKGCHGSNYSRGRREFDLTTDDLTDVSLDMNLVGFVIACVAHENGFNLDRGPVRKLIELCRYEPPPPPVDRMKQRMQSLVSLLAIGEGKGGALDLMRLEAQSIMRALGEEPPKKATRKARRPTLAREVR